MMDKSVAIVTGASQGIGRATAIRLAPYALLPAIAIPILISFMMAPVVYRMEAKNNVVIVQPNIGVVYTGGTKKLAEHGGFAFDDTNVMMLVANPGMEPTTVYSPVETAQIAPTILALLGLDPNSLIAVQNEGTCWMGGTMWHGQRLMRISVSNWTTTADDVDRSVEAIQRAFASVR